MKNILTTLFLLTFLFAQGQTSELEYDWQKKIADKPNKSILDYYLLLPSKLVSGESGLKDSYEFRINSTQTKGKSKVNIKNGYLAAGPDAFIHLALFKNMNDGEDIIAYVKDCGEMPVQSCDYGFLTFDNKSKRWKNANYIFPFEKMKAKCLKIEKVKNWYDEPEVIPYLILPEFGTTIKIMDAYSDDEHLLFIAKWNGKRFEIQ